MNDLDFSFEDSPWEVYLRTKKTGEKVSAAQMLAMLEGEEEQAVEDAFQEMEQKQLVLDISDLPKFAGSGEAAVRLRQEVQLVQKGLPFGELEPNDPLRLYLEEVALIPTGGDEQSLAARCAREDERAMEALTNLGLHRVLTIAACTSIVITAVYILRLVGKILYGTCTNKHHLELTDATWDERFAVICLILAVAGLGMAPLWVSNVITDGVAPIVDHIQAAAHQVSTCNPFM